jgi:hypothetical protein
LACRNYILPETLLEDVTEEPRMRRRIKKANISFVSLCPRGKNRMPTLYKADGSVEFETLIKDEGFEAKGELTAVVYAPEVRDTDGDVASVEVIKQMAYDYMKDGGKLDVRHDGKALTQEQAFIAETFLIQKGDSRFQNMQTDDGVVVDVTGGWAMVVKVDDPELRKAYGEDGWGGVSIFGKAKVEVEEDKAAEETNRIVKALAKKVLGVSSDEEIEMTKEEMAQFHKENNAALSKSITDGILAGLKKEPEVKPEGDIKPKDIKFEGDPTNADDLKKHYAKINKAQLMESVDFNDPDALKKHMASLEKSKGEGDGEGDKGETDEVKALRKQLDAALGKSSQPSKEKGEGEGEGEADFTGLSKEEVEGFKVGSKMAAFSNRTRGFIAAK